MNVRSLQPGILTAVWLLPILAIFQAGMMSHMGVRGAYPVLILVAVVDWGILRGVDEGVIWALIGGFAIDVFSGWPIGTSMVALAVVASVMSLGSGTFMRTHALLAPAMAFGGTLLYYLIVIFILASLHQPLDLGTALRTLVLPSAVYNAVLNVAIFPLLQRLESRVYPVPRANW